MAVKQIKTFPDPILREKSSEVEDFESDEFKDLVQDLKDTLDAQRAQGLAAVQIGVPKRAMAVKLGVEEVRILVNPVLTDMEDELVWREGCLSFPGVEENIKRFGDITVTAQDENGDEVALSLYELDAVAVQHEYDHLEGVLFIDRVSKLKKRFMLKRMKNWMRKRGIQFRG